MGSAQCAPTDDERSLALQWVTALTTASRLHLGRENRAVTARQLTWAYAAALSVVAFGVPAVGAALDARLLRGGLSTRGHEQHYRRLLRLPCRIGLILRSSLGSTCNTVRKQSSHNRCQACSPCGTRRSGTVFIWAGFWQRGQGTSGKLSVRPF